MATGKMPGFLLEPEVVRASTQVASPTAVPVFVGYVQSLAQGMRGVVTPIARFSEYVRHFGGGTLTAADLPWAGIAPDGSLMAKGPFLRNSVYQYFMNGGGPCYVLAVGTYATDRLPAAADFADVPSILEHVPEITLVLPTDAILLPAVDYYACCRGLLQHCAEATNRFCILDAGNSGPKVGSGFAAARAFVQALGQRGLTHGAAYFPMLQLRETPIDADQLGANRPMIGPMIGLASAAVAAAYGVTDQSRGIWKAPANVALSNVVGLASALSLKEMGELYEPEDGKAVNVIRSIPGRGIYVWGARTLAANDLDWRYVNVRRMMSFVEATLRSRTLFAVFEPNSLRTWIVVKGLCDSFLKGLWEAGGLAGQRKEDAYKISIGLGESMTQADIDEGRLIAIVQLAPRRPAEFITIRLFHQVQALGNQ